MSTNSLRSRQSSGSPLKSLRELTSSLGKGHSVQKNVSEQSPLASNKEESDHRVMGDVGGSSMRTSGYNIKKSFGQSQAKEKGLNSELYRIYGGSRNANDVL